MQQLKKKYGEIEVKMVGEIYSRMYKIENIQHVVNLVNDVFGNEIHIKIKEVKEKFEKE